MYTLKIPKMKCSGCMNTIKNAILGLDEKADIQFDLSIKQVSIASYMPIETIKSKLADVGYPVDEDS
jgi:copper chaperone